MILKVIPMAVIWINGLIGEQISKAGGFEFIDKISLHVLQRTLEDIIL